MDKRKHSRKNNHRDEGSPSVAGVIKSCLCGLLISLAAALVILALTAAYALGKSDPDDIMVPLSSFLAYPCAILGGFISCKLYKENPVMCGLIYSIMNVSLSILLYPLLPETGNHSMSALSFFGLRALLLVCCVAGCLMGAKSVENRKRHRRKKR